MWKFTEFQKHFTVILHWGFDSFMYRSFEIMNKF